MPAQINTQQTSQSQTVPAPIGGLNGRDPRADMSKTDAYLMDNWFPGTASVKSRQGCTKHSSASLGGPALSLEVYSGATETLLSFAGGKVFDVSVPVAVQLDTGRLNDYVISTMFSNSADTSQHLIIVNGFDQPSHYTAGTYSDLTFTGMVGSQNTLNFVFAFKGRLYFGQKDKIGFYYLPVGQIQGALSYFDLGQVAKLGGTLVAVASYSETSGDTPNDYITFITSRGEHIVYAGYDPSNSATWVLVGRYYSSEPIGARCTVNYGSELVILTKEGAVSFSEIRTSGNPASRNIVNTDNGVITSKLGSYLSAFNINSGVQGWEGCLYTSQADVGWLILNVPSTSAVSGAYYHYIMNTTTNAWCRFTSWNGLCFAVFNGRLYFGRYDGYIMLGDEGRLDDGEEIKCDCKQAYNYFEDGSGLGLLQKHFQWATLWVSCDGSPPLSGKFNVDFTEDAPDYSSALAPSSGSEWDTTDWDVGVWGFDAQTQRVLITLNTQGIAGALWLRAALQGVALEWYNTQYVMQKTRGLLI